MTVHPDGRLEVLGRLGSTIKVGAGRWLSCARVEAILLSAANHLLRTAFVTVVEGDVPVVVAVPIEKQNNDDDPNRILIEVQIVVNFII